MTGGLPRARPILCSSQYSDACSQSESAAHMCAASASLRRPMGRVVDLLQILNGGEFLVCLPLRVSPMLSTPFSRTGTAIFLIGSPSA